MIFTEGQRGHNMVYSIDTDQAFMVMLNPTLLK